MHMEAGLDILTSAYLLPFQHVLAVVPNEVHMFSLFLCAHVSFLHSVFEFQLMPPFIYLMKLSPEEMEFGTVMIFVCSRSCGNSGYCAEFLFVQNEWILILLFCYSCQLVFFPSGKCVICMSGSMSMRMCCVCVCVVYVGVVYGGGVCMYCK